MRAFRLSLVLLVILGFSSSLVAQESVPSSSRQRTSRSSTNSKRPNQAGGGVAAVVRTDGALVYAQPDFDAEVLSTLNEGQSIRVSRGTTGQFAKFHKVRVGPILGYIAEIDVQVEGATKKRTHKRADKKQEKKKKKDDGPQLPMMFSRFVGVLVGQTSYKEGIQGADEDANLLTYGLKVTGPDVVLDGPIMDLNVQLHYGAPSYYDRLSETKPTGFILWVDPLLLLPFVNGQNSMVYLGAGPVLVLSNFKVYNTNRMMDLTALNVGASFSVGAGFRIEKVAVRAEAKYYLEKTSYKGILLSVQSQF